MSEPFLTNAVELKPTQQFAYVQMTSREIEEDAGFSLVTYLVERMLHHIQEYMRAGGYTVITGGPKIEREEWHDWVTVRGRGLRRVAERLGLLEPRRMYKHLGYRYRMSLWAR